MAIGNTREMNGRLGGGGRARGYIAKEDNGNHSDHRRSFRAIDSRNQSEVERRSSNGDACRGADGTGVGIHSGGVEVHTAMQLSREEDAREEEGRRQTYRELLGILPGIGLGAMQRNTHHSTRRGDLRKGEAGIAEQGAEEEEV